VLIGREDLLRVRASLGRISDELHLILGVLDQHLEAPPVAHPAGASGAHSGFGASAGVPAEHEGAVPLPREAPGSETVTPPPRALMEEPRPGLVGPWAWAIGEWLFWLGICALDVSIVVGMQLFLESIGRKRGGSSIMPKRSVATAIATKAAGAPPPGAPIPAPSATPGRASTQRLSVLSQEELLAACLTAHWGKLAVAVGLAVACRLPQQVLNSDGFICNMLANLTVMLRCMSLVMLLIRDDMALPKKDKADKGAVPPPPPPPVPRRRTSGGSSE